jgi:hypothetical protein
MEEIKEYDGPLTLNINAEYTITQFPDSPNEFTRKYWKDLTFIDKKGST